MFFRKWFVVVTITVSVIIDDGNGNEVTQAMTVGDSKNANECVSAPCLNGGRCCEGVDTYTCTCEPGFTGQQCQTNFDECSSAPCMNGGSCIDGVNEYTCTCESGFTGQQCQTNIDDCSSAPCLNGGSCLDGVNAYTCACRPGFSGTQCQTASPAILVLRNDWVSSRYPFFNRSWAEYEQEFGSDTTQYWIGLSKLYSMSQNYCNIRFNVQAQNGSWFYAEYSRFSVGGPSTNYKLSIDGHSGNAGDAMAYHNGRPFSTYDRVAPDLGSDFFDCGGGFWFAIYSHQPAMLTTGSARCALGWFPPQGGFSDYTNAVAVYIRC